MENFLIGGNSYGSGCINYALNIQRLNFYITNSNDAMGIETTNMTTRNARINRMD